MYIINSYREYPKSNIASGLLGASFLVAGGFVTLALARIKPFAQMNRLPKWSLIGVDAAAYAAAALALGGAPKVIQLIGRKLRAEKQEEKDYSQFSIQVADWPAIDKLEENAELKEAFDNMLAEPGSAVGDWIEGGSGTRYFARSHPGLNDDIWKFCFNNNVENVVNVNGRCNSPYCVEGGIVKSIKEEHIRCEGSRFSYILKRTVTLERDGKSKTVVHWHVRHWVDGQPPEHGALVTLLELLGKQTGNMVVHCQAGEGRTGTFMLAREVRHQIVHRDARSVDVMGMLREFRKKRYLIHNYQQLLAAFEVGRHCATGDDSCGISLDKREWKGSFEWTKFGIGEPPEEFETRCSKGEIETAKRLLGDRWPVPKSDLEWAWKKKKVTLWELLHTGPGADDDPRSFFQLLLDGELKKLLDK